MITEEILRRIRLLIDAVKRTDQKRRLTREQSDLIDAIAPSERGRGRGIKQLRWTIGQAAQEFAVDRNTIRSALTVSNVQAGKDNCFSTMQIHKALTTDFDFEKTRLTKAQATLAEAKLDILENNWFPREGVERVLETIIILLRNKIAESELPEHLKIDILKDLKTATADEYLVAKVSELEDSEAETEPA
jgi:hypothetical protein